MSDAPTSQEKETRFEALKKIRDEVVALENSELVKLRKENGYHPVIGQGSHFADILFTGEAPGETEAKTGVPFCGRAGKVLDELLESVGIAREDVYITNIVKDRPPKNRDPRPDEIEMYAPFLDRQVETIQPKVIATLGRFSMEYIMRRYGLEDKVAPISKIHGQHFETNFDYGTVHIVPLYHPAVALYDGSQREILKKDFEILKTFT